MGLYGGFVRRYSGTRWFAWVAARTAPRLDLLVHRMSHGRRLATPNEVPTLLLTTHGRRSGEPRTVPLSFATMDDALFVVGTNFGQAHQPAWALNLLHRPEAVAEYRGERWEVRASRVPEDARGDLWSAFDAIVPAYRNYRSRVDRPIHMFRLERV